ncbi:MAG: ATP-dependent Clp protease adapter ClpS [Bdellovibrionales bacterium]|nr:ATP-dependent Clp protease adapter ClpS [Bdellovibrionales bacterium]
MAKNEEDGGVQTIDKESIEVKEPTLYKVLLLNDDYTTMDFVVSILETVFSKSPAEAVRIMLSVHNKGRGLCGLFPKQIAEAKLQTVHAKAKAQGHPLRCVMEEV